MKVQIDETKKTMTITLSIDTALPLSKRGRSRILATTSGFVEADIRYKDKPISVSVNAIVPK